MVAATVQLTGTATIGVQPELIGHRLLATLPREVRLGRIEPKSRPVAPELRFYLNTGMATGLPDSTNWRAKAAPALARMYDNDVLGCCVISAVAHMFGVWTANDALSTAMATDPEISSQYHAFCGPGDNGCMINSVLDILKTRGMMLGGVLHKIEGYVAADWTNQLETRTVLYLSGASNIGINLPKAWTENAVWDIPTGAGAQIVGGHSVTPIDYAQEGVYVSSWGRLYLVTWPAWTSRTWLSELYMILGPDWWNNDLLAPNGIDVATLRADQIKIGSGIIPPIGPPGPPPPPPPPGTGPALADVLAAQSQAVAALKARNNRHWWPAIDATGKACAAAVTPLWTTPHQVVTCEPALQPFVD